MTNSEMATELLYAMYIYTQSKFLLIIYIHTSLGKYELW